jgi:hypothetical protein
LPSGALGKVFAECLHVFAECSGHSANQPRPVVMTFEEGQERRYEKENQQFDEEGKWTSPPTSSILSIA